MTEWNETILKLLEIAETLYKIDGKSVLHDLSSDGMKILGDYYDRKELKRFLEGK